jgi:hypothetical protein
MRAPHRGTVRAVPVMGPTLMFQRKMLMCSEKSSLSGLRSRLAGDRTRKYHENLLKELREFVIVKGTPIRPRIVHL